MRHYAFLPHYSAGIKVAHKFGKSDQTCLISYGHASCCDAISGSCILAHAVLLHRHSFPVRQRRRASIRMPASFVLQKGVPMKVAFTSTNGEMIDQHFGQCTSFHVWEIGPDEAVQLPSISAITSAEDEEDRIAARAAAITGCAIVYTMQIGGPAAAKLVARKIHPMKTNAEVPVADIVSKLQAVLQGNPPPWLKKAMHKDERKSFLD